MIFSLLTGTAESTDGMNFLPIILDIVALVFLIVFMIKGYKKGFLKGIAGLLGLIVSFFVAFSFAGHLANLLESCFGLSSMLADGLEGSLSGIAGFDAIIEKDSLAETLSVLALPDFLKDTILEVLAGIEFEDGAFTIAQVLAPVFAGFLISILCGLVLFIITALLMSLLTNLLSSLFDKIPLIGTLNHILGLVLGAIKGLIYLYVILAVLSFLPFQELQEFLSQTVFIKWLVENNLIVILFTQISSLEGIMQMVQDFIDGLMGGAAPAIVA